MRKYFGITAAIVVVVAVLVIGTFAVAGATSQAWLLDNNLVMERTDSTGNDGQSGAVQMTPGQIRYWIADEAAEPPSGVTFSGSPDSWVINLETTDWTSDCEVRVGIWDGANFTAFSGQSQGSAIYLGSSIMKVQVQAGPTNVSQGNELALEIKNTSSSNTYSITTDGDSRLVSPGSDPGYPTPELTTGILLGVGLLGLGGFIFIKRKRAGKASN